MNENISIAGVSERDVDLLLLEEFLSSISFQKWFVDHVLGDENELGQCVGAGHSVKDSTGESDLEVTFLNADGKRTRFLIENKIGAGLQPRQAERYQVRGSNRVSGGECNEYCSVIVAPSHYFGKSDATKGFDHRITYEEIRDWFEKAEDLGKRRLYKVTLLRTAIEKATLGYRREEDAATSSFWRDYWRYSCKYAPELEMREPAGNPSGSTFVYFHPPSLPRRITLVHKLTHGCVDLQLGGLAPRLNALRADIGFHLAKDITLTAAGNSAAIRIKTPQLHFNAGADGQSAEIISGLHAAQRLLAWFSANKDTLNKYLYSTPQSVAEDSSEPQN